MNHNKPNRLSMHKMKTFLLIVLCATVTIFASEQEFSTATNSFAATAYKEILKTETNNFVVSPFSAEIILTLTQSGCKGRTAEELRSALHLPDNPRRIEQEVRNWLQTLKGNDLYALHTANKIYVKNDFALKNGFRKVVTDVYSAASESIDFRRNVKAAQVMNKWVEKQTENKIQNLISSDDLDDYTRIVLINALYFKAKWSAPFDYLFTRKMNFSKTPSEVVKVHTMYSGNGESFLYSESPTLNAKFLELPFKGNEASMTIILPKDRELTTLESQINRALSLQDFKNEIVDVAIPKFKIESRIDFKEILQNLGVQTVFRDFEADLSGIAGEKGDLVVSKVVQKSFISVNEEGVEAGAATHGYGIVPLSGHRSKKFFVDRPFIFYIRVKGVIIFVGRVTDPRV